MWNIQGGPKLGIQFNVYVLLGHTVFSCNHQVVCKETTQIWVVEVDSEGGEG
jgi:hypothetical protein